MEIVIVIVIVTQVRLGVSNSKKKIMEKKLNDIVSKYHHH